MRNSSGLLLIAILTVVSEWCATPAHGQDAAPRTSAGAEGDAQEAARRKVLESDRWRGTRREWNEWLSVQRTYTPDEVAAIQAELAARVDKMSPRELEDFCEEMAERLEVLLSPEADEARDWLSQFLSVVRNPEEQLRRKRSDVLNMSASEIRQELRRFQQQRAATQQSQAAFERGRAQQAQLARQVQAGRREAQSQAQDVRSRAAANMLYRSRYSPRPEQLPHHSEFVPFDDHGPAYTVSPWGTPIRWDPLHARNR